MRIEIISGGESSVHAIPEQVNFIGFTLENPKRLLNINSGFSEEFYNLPMQCTNQCDPDQTPYAGSGERERTQCGAV